jgi:hypothetical protein
MSRLATHGKERVPEDFAQQIEFPLAIPVCAWCKPGSGGKGLKVISHGICLHHLRKMRLELMKRAAEAA